jgi:hypothetical protein
MSETRHFFKNPCLLFDPGNPGYPTKMDSDPSETVDGEQRTEHAVAEPAPALRRQPAKLSHYLQRFRALLDKGHYAALIKLLNTMYSKALDGDELARAFYRQVDKMLGKENELSHRLQAHPELHRLIDWQLKQLNQTPTQQTAPVPRPYSSAMRG